MWLPIFATLNLVAWLAQIIMNSMTRRRLQSHDVLIAKLRVVVSLAVKKSPGWSDELIREAEDLIRKHIPEATSKIMKKRRDA